MQLSDKLLSAGISIESEFQAGDLGHLVYLHGVQNRQDYGFNHVHEAYCAQIAIDFILRFAADRSRVWLAKKEGQVVGSVFIFENDGQAQLRLLFVDRNVRGLGLGRWLVGASVDYARKAQFKKVFLWTVLGLDRAVRVYESLGFRETDRKTQKQWGRVSTEIRYDLTLRE
jgi:GNAT superfamily N-acetyltransferase